MNVDLSKVMPGTPGVTHGSGLIGELIRTATQSWAGHAVGYIGSGQIVEGTAPSTRIAPAASHDDTRWFYKMWDQIQAEGGLTTAEILAMQNRAVARYHALVGTPYDYPAYIGFGLEVTHLRNGTQLDPVFKADTWRICSADVVDATTYAGYTFDWSKIQMKPGYDVNLISPAMLYDYAVMLSWL